MAIPLKRTDNEIGEVLLQNENLQTEMYIDSHNHNVKTYKGNSSGVKYGLSELSNDKMYLETELPARKRLKRETELFIDTKLVNKICKATGKDNKLVNFENVEKSSCKISNRLHSKQGFENFQSAELLKSNLSKNTNKQNKPSGISNFVSPNIVSKQVELNFKELKEKDFIKSDNDDFESNSEKNLRKYLDKVSGKDESETSIDDEINKCYELLNLDVPRMAVFGATSTETTADNFDVKMIDKSQIQNCAIYNLKDKKSDWKNINFRTQNYKGNCGTEHLSLTIEDTLRSDILKWQETTQDMSQDPLDEEINEIESTVSDSCDTLILYVESDIDTNEAYEIKEPIAKKSAILKKTSKSNETVSYPCLDIKNSNEVGKTDILLRGKIDQLDENHSLGIENFKPLVLDGISKNDKMEDKSYSCDKADESFVSEYEISLLVDDTNSIISEESLGSEYEVSLLEVDSSDEENQEDMHESKSDCNVNSQYLPNNNGKDEKIATITEHSEVKAEYKDEHTGDSVNLSDQGRILFENEINSKNISEKNIDSCPKESIGSNCFKHREAISKTDLSMKILAQKEETPLLNKIESNENTTNKNEQCVTAINEGILKLDQPTASESKNVLDYTLIKKKPLESIKDYKLHLKLETERYEAKAVIKTNNNAGNSETDKAIIQKFRKIDVFDSKEIEIVYCNIVKKYKENIFVDTNKRLIKSHSSDKAKDERNEKTDLSVSASSEIKKDVEKAVSDSEVNKTKAYKENISVNINKPLIKSTSITTEGERTEKSDSTESASSAIKKEEENIIPDYYEAEKEDLTNPGWDKIKELSTDEERYRQVRDCWESTNIPNPFKNLTHYSYRKRKVTGGVNNYHEIKQHKRHATNNLNDKNAKRSRTCTYIFDDRINSIQKEKEQKEKNIHHRMFGEIDRLQEQMRLKQSNGYNFDPYWKQYELNGLQQRISFVTANYEKQVYDCNDRYTSEIDSLKNKRNEVLQFYSFYKGLNPMEYKDPTILTDAQMQELEEIENIYKQMDFHYQ